MNIVERLQRLDALIIKNTQPPATAILRNEVSLCTEEAEAHAERGEQQDRTLATQVKTIEALMKEKEELVATVARLQTPPGRVRLVPEPYETEPLPGPSKDDFR